MSGVRSLHPALRTNTPLGFLGLQGSLVGEQQIWPCLGDPNPSVGAAVRLAARKKAADEFAAKMLPIIHAIRAASRHWPALGRALGSS